MKKLGDKGERLAERYLRRSGFAILARNYRCPCGEIDIIAREGGVTAFVEVRGKSGGNFGDALESVTPKKKRRLFRAAEHFMAVNRLADVHSRFDVVGIHWRPGSRPEVVLIRDAFRLER